MEGRATLTTATQQTDANLAQLGAYVCANPGDGLPATMLATLYSFVSTFDQSMRFVAVQP